MQMLEPPGEEEEEEEPMPSLTAEGIALVIVDVAVGFPCL